MPVRLALGLGFLPGLLVGIHFSRFYSKVGKSFLGPQDKECRPSLLDCLSINQELFEELEECRRGEIDEL